MHISIKEKELESKIELASSTRVKSSRMQKLLNLSKSMLSTMFDISSGACPERLSEKQQTRNQVKGLGDAWVDGNLVKDDGIYRNSP